MRVIISAAHTPTLSVAWLNVIQIMAWVEPL